MPSATRRPGADPSHTPMPAHGGRLPRIAIVTPMLPIPEDRTRGRYIHETARSLSKLTETRVFFQQLRYLRLPGATPRSFLSGVAGPDYRVDGVEVEAFCYPAVTGLSRPFNGAVASRYLTPRVRAFAPDVVLGYWVYPDGYAALRCARELGVPCVVGALGSDIHVRSGTNASLTRKTIAGADALITVSDAMGAAAIRDFAADPARTHTVVNGFNTSVFRPMDQTAVRARLGIDNDTRLIAYVGRFVEAKGMRELVAAFGSLAASDPAVRLVLIGEGVMEAELRQLVAVAGLADRIAFPGGMEPAQVAEWICASDVLTLPSWSEGYPNVVVEALACGRPAVATDVGGTREIIGPDSGYLIPPKDVASLERALRDALDRRWDHAAIAARMQRSWDDVARETLAICQHVCAEGTGRRAVGA